MFRSCVSYWLKDFGVPVFLSYETHFLADNENQHDLNTNKIEAQLCAPELMLQFFKSHL